MCTFLFCVFWSSSNCRLFHINVRNNASELKTLQIFLSLSSQNIEPSWADLHWWRGAKGMKKSTIKSSQNLSDDVTYKSQLEVSETNRKCLWSGEFQYDVFHFWTTKDFSKPQIKLRGKGFVSISRVIYSTQAGFDLQWRLLLP